MNIDELIEEIETEYQQAKTRKERAAAKAAAILTKASGEGRASLTDQEDEDVQASFGLRDKAKADMRGIETKLARAQNVKAEEQETKLALRERQGDSAKAVAEKPAYDRVSRVGREERTYHRGNTGKGGPFLRDVIDQFLYRDIQAEQRLNDHMREERVERGQYLTRAAGDTNTANWSGLVVPQYLTEMYAPAIAGLRPFADICNHHDLPASGMSVNISMVTTASSNALQALEFDLVSATTIDDSILTETVQTAAGQQTLSRQAIDRGTGIEEVVMDDLFRRYATTLDKTLITQATTGLDAVSTLTAFTSTTPAFVSATAADSLYGKILGAASGVEAALLAYGSPTHVVMHSRRWYWINAKVSATWPGISQPSIPVQAAGTNAAGAYNSGVRGVLPNGLAVIVDNNVPITQGTESLSDPVYVVPASECHLWEDPAAPVFIRAEQAKAANLGVLLVLYGYFAYSFRRYSNAIGKILGTGSTTPGF